MKKTMKGVSLMLAAASVACLGLTACNKKVVVDEKTITVKCLRAGFGTDWLYELKGKFESVYAEQGYKVNIMTPDLSIKGDTVIKELALGYDKTQVDLYLTSGAFPDMVGELGDYGILVEDIRESVFNQPAISYDGTEESELISEKLSEDVIPFVTDVNGIMYAYNWAQTSGGLAVNTRKLADYGLEIPKTTNEMFDCFQKIYCGHNGVANSISSGTYPITYVPGGNGYSVCFLYALMAQYDQEFFDEFWYFQKTSEDGSVVNMTDAECIDMYNDPAMLEMMKVAYSTFDMMIAAPSSLSQSVDQAQAKIMGDVDGAVFMFNGDWMLNEVKLNYRNKLNDIDFVNYPVISALGTKLFGAGTSYNLSEAKCDELLSYIIDLVDQNKEIEEMVAAVKADSKWGIDVKAEDVTEVARARGVSYSRGVEHLGYITKNSTKKDIASLFLRMMSSDDFGKTFNNTANGATPYYAQENTTSEYKFVRNASKIPANKYFSLVSLAKGAEGYREQLNLQGLFTIQGHIPDYISSESTASIFNEKGELNGKDKSVYETAAKSLLQEEIKNLTNNWETYKKSAGL
ncbi:MAG: hypothetical protein IJX49_04005 [Clostridia bacterium]|nr:hypothetical protein [Clostridia bacterium]